MAAVLCVAGADYAFYPAGECVGADFDMRPDRVLAGVEGFDGEPGKEFANGGVTRTMN